MPNSEHYFDNIKKSHSLIYRKCPTTNYSNKNKINMQRPMKHKKSTDLLAQGISYCALLKFNILLQQKKKNNKTC